MIRSKLGFRDNEHFCTIVHQVKVFRFFYINQVLGHGFWVFNILPAPLTFSKRKIFSLRTVYKIIKKEGYV